jgi:hypothetical protein
MKSIRHATIGLVVLAPATVLCASCAEPVDSHVSRPEVAESVPGLDSREKPTLHDDVRYLLAPEEGGERLGEAQEPVGPNGGREPLTLAGKLCLMAVSYAMTFGCGAATQACKTDGYVDVNGIAVPCWIFQYIGCGTISGLSAIRAVTLCSRL